MITRSHYDVIVRPVITEKSMAGTARIVPATRPLTRSCRVSWSRAGPARQAIRSSLSLPFSACS